MNRQRPPRIAAHQVFPPRPDYASLSVSDLVAAREHYSRALASLPNVIATAIGRYRIHEKDWYAQNPPDKPRPHGTPLVDEPRTLANSIVRSWSWPSVLVFVRDWMPRGHAGSVPRTLYLPDGRVVPTCVIHADVDTTPFPDAKPGFPGSLVGGGYPCFREHQGQKMFGTIGCIVERDGTFFALTSAHVAGEEGDLVSAVVRGQERVIGRTTGHTVDRRRVRELFPSWPGEQTEVKLDLGLVRIDDIDAWTSQIYGVGELEECFDATETSVTLDLIGLPVRAFGAASGAIEGEIQGLFFRYETRAGVDRVADLLIGPRRDAHPLSRPGDSGSVWVYDPPRDAPEESHPDVGQMTRADRGRRARRLRPLAMQWGGGRMKGAPEPHAFALASFLSSGLASLGVEVVADHSTGHDEYWGKLGHFAIGYRAANHVSGGLATLLKNNQANLGYDDATLSADGFAQDRKKFVPLADVPDYVWVGRRQDKEPAQHFGDIDIVDIDGDTPLIDRCLADSRNLSAKVWKKFFDGFAEAGVGPNEGLLPLRVWQLFDLMVDSLEKRDVVSFVAAGGVMAHYVGDASQPLHGTWMHHGMPPTITVHGRKYPIRHEDPKHDAWSKTWPYKVHGIYEEQMLEVDTATALTMLTDELGDFVAKGEITSGHEAAIAVIALMDRARKLLSPQTIFAADDPKKKAPDRAEQLWNDPAIRSATAKLLAESVKLQAELWQSAWKVAGAQNEQLSHAAIPSPTLRNLYMSASFAPSLTLAEMVEQGLCEPPARAG